MSNMIILLLTGWAVTALILVAWIIKYRTQERRKKKDNRKLLKD